MANGPRPGCARRGVVRPPNQSGPDGNRARNSNRPLEASAGPGLAAAHGGDGREGCVPLHGGRCPVRPPGHRFDVDAAKMPQPPSAVEPGKGAIPVIPWDASGRPVRAAIEPDAERPPRR